MFWKFVRESLWRPQNRRRALWAVLAVALGTAVAAAMLSVSLDVGDKMGKELRSLGANIAITPAADSLPIEIGGIDYRPVSEGAYVSESSLGKLKEIFWRNNIVAFSPFLYMPARVISRPPASGSSTILVGTWFDRPFSTSEGERFHTGIRPLNPTWKLDGEWIDDSGPEAPGPVCVVGRSLADALGLRIGDTVRLAVDKAVDKEVEANNSGAALSLLVKGILTTGGAEDEQIFVSLQWIQSQAGLEDKVRKVQVSAIIKPEDELSRRNPGAMTPAEYDRWYCSPYISSILHQIRDALPGTAVLQIRPVAETQGNVLGKLTFLMGALAILALVATALTISSLAGLSVLERRHEIGMMKALGAPDGLVSLLFLAEAAFQGSAGGVLGFAAGHLLARLLGKAVFGADVAVNWILLPMILLVAVGVSFLGSLAAVSRAVQLKPAVVLRGE